MKNIVPFLLRLAIFPLLLLLAAWSGVNAQGNNNNQTTPELRFHNPSLISGQAGAVGAIYRFRRVTANTDALVRITDRSSDVVKLEDLDIKNTGFLRALQPKISYQNDQEPNSHDWWMEFEVSFVKQHTMTKADINSFKATALDIDGDNRELHESISFYGLQSYTLEENSSLSVDEISQGNQVSGIYVKGITDQYDGIDTVQTDVMVTAAFESDNIFVFRAGASASGAIQTERLYSIWFRDFDYEAPVLATLPAEITSFTAKLSNGKTNLKWTTASEMDVNYFSLEKSLDGANYSEIERIQAAGNSDVSRKYAYTDQYPGAAPTNLVYYRLRVVDIDGQSEISGIRTIRITKKSGQRIRLVAYPNPVRNNIQVSVPATWQNKEVSYQITGFQGAVQKKLVSVSSGTPERINLDDLRKGHYVLTAVCGEETARVKIIKR